jgi:hypothetical protein
VTCDYVAIGVGEASWDVLIFLHESTYSLGHSVRTSISL